MLKTSFFSRMDGAERLRGSEIDRYLYDVTDSMAEDSEYGGDSDAEDFFSTNQPSTTSSSARNSKDPSASSSPAPSMASAEGHRRLRNSTPSVSPATSMTFSPDGQRRSELRLEPNQLPSTSASGPVLTQRDLDYIFDSDDSQNDPTYEPPERAAGNIHNSGFETESNYSSSNSDEEAEDSDSSGPRFTFDKTSSDPKTFNDFKFDQPIGPKIHVDISSPLSILLFFIGSFLADIVNQSNLFARQNHVDLNLTNDELLAFFGILVVMGFHPLPGMRLYWSNDPYFHVEVVSSVMSLKRFLKILRFLHLNDNSKMIGRGQPGFDKLFKIRPLIDHLKCKFQEAFFPSRFLSVDESMIGFKGRSSLKQYLPMKPIKRGFKVWAICCSVTGYMLCLDVYEGKSNMNREGDDTLGSSVVLQLSKAFEMLGYCIFFDRFFSTIPLIEKLLSKKLFGCGTIQKNRKYLPHDLLLPDKSMKMGQFDSASCGEISISKWKDRGKASVMIVSGMHKSSDEAEVKRKNKTGERVIVKCPKSVAEYNKNMGGVDRFDHLMAVYSISQKSRRWWIKIFYYLLESAIVNSFILYNYICKNSPTLNEKPLTHLMFRRKLADEMIKPWANRPKKNKNVIVKGRKDSGRLVSANLSIENVGEHLPIKCTIRRCARCSTKVKVKRSTMACQKCKVALCKECFVPFHSK